MHNLLSFSDLCNGYLDYLYTSKYNKHLTTNMKKIYFTLLTMLFPLLMMAQGWPANYSGVMLQGFYWDSYNETKWTQLTSQANELSQYFDVIWIPNSGQVAGGATAQDMGYMPCYWFTHNTIFGTQDELKTMIQTFKTKGTSIMEDVVVNHKNGLKDWCDFPGETWNGKTLTWSLADICCNDEASSHGYAVSGATDTGDNFDGCRDLDHTSLNVQKNIKIYLDFLQQELGYTGFRYDMVKGYSPKFNGIYNAYANPTFSVGEYWDGSYDNTTGWINGTKNNGIIESAAFDFPLKISMNNVFNNSTWSGLSNKGIAGSVMNRYAVTFVDNHDTYRSGSIPMTNNIVAANAFILALPGTPCIFWPHWVAYKTELEKMIKARKAAGITNQSSIIYQGEYGGGYVTKVQGTKGTVMVMSGYVSGYNVDGFTKVSDGTNYAYYVSNDVDLNATLENANIGSGIPVVDKPSGSYTSSVTVNVKPSNEWTTLVYTTDGNDPTASSASLTAATNLNFTTNTTLKVGVLKDGNVSSISTYDYRISANATNTITVYVKADQTPIYLYAWDGYNNQTTNILTSSWPGTKLSNKRIIGGETWYYMTFNKSADDYSLNFILSNGSAATKSSDVTNVSSDYFTSLSNNTASNLTNNYIFQLTDGSLTEDYSNLTTIYVKAEEYPVNLYAWDSSNNYINGAWPGSQMTDKKTIGGVEWYYKSFDKATYPTVNFQLNKGGNTTQTGDITGITSDYYCTYNSGSKSASDVTATYQYVPEDDLYQAGELTAFFEAPSSWLTVNCWAWNGSTNFTGGTWPGVSCTKVGVASNGNIIWKWNGGTLSVNIPANIIFSNNGSSQTSDLVFTNGGYYTTGSTQSTLETTGINATSLTNGTTEATYFWNGRIKNVQSATASQTLSKDVYLPAGTYTVQAIVRGTAGSTVTLNANGTSASASVDGLNGATSTVSTDGVVDDVVTGANNGWHKVQVTCTLTADGNLPVSLTSAAANWQVAAVKILKDADTSGKYQTTASTTVTKTNEDETAETKFMFYDRGINKNCLVKATATSPIAQLPCNVIVGGTCSNLVLTDGNYSFNANEAFTASDASYTRNYNISQNSTVCLPFALTTDQVNAAGKLYELTSWIDNDLRFTRVTTTEAYKPYFFIPNAEQPFMNLGEKNVSVTSIIPVTKDNITFKGTMNRKNLVSSATNTYYGYLESNGTFVKIGTGAGANINPFRAYLSTPDANGAKTLNVVFMDETDGITTIETDNNVQGAIYSIDGRIVRNDGNLNSLQKGIYIRNGHKFIIK